MQFSTQSQSAQEELDLDIAQGSQRSNFLDAVSDVRIRQYFTQLYAVGLSVYF